MRIRSIKPQIALRGFVTSCFNFFFRRLRIVISADRNRLVARVYDQMGDGLVPRPFSENP